MRRIILIAIMMLCVACGGTTPTLAPPTSTTQPPTPIPDPPTPIPPTDTPISPTPTNTTIPPTVTPTQLILETVDEAINLLVAGWQLRATPDELRPQLIANNWLSADNTVQEWQEIEGAWIVTLGNDNWNPVPIEDQPDDQPWDVVVIDDTGVRYRYTKDVSTGAFTQPARFVAAMDFDQFDESDGTDQSELIMMHSDCGAHTCYDTYHVIQRQPDGSYIRITDDAGMTNSYTDAPSMTMFEGQTALAIHGGAISSAGAGPYQRLWTSYWVLNQTTNRIELADEVRDESPYRFHALHDANELFDEEAYGEAQLLYEQIVNDTITYEDPAGFMNGISTYDSTRQFAAFRLILLHEITGEAAAQANWINWLTATYPDSMAAGSVPIFVENEGTLAEKCLAVVDWLTVQEGERGEPSAGTIADLGYQLPNLTADTFCPILPEPQTVQFDSGGIAQQISGDVTELPATYRFFVSDGQPLWLEPQSEAVNIFLVASYGYRSEPFYDEDGIWRTYTSGYPDYFDLVVRDSLDSAETSWTVTVTILPAEQ